MLEIKTRKKLKIKIKVEIEIRERKIKIRKRTGKKCYKYQQKEHSKENIFS